MSRIIVRFILLCLLSCSAFATLGAPSVGLSIQGKGGAEAAQYTDYNGVIFTPETGFAGFNVGKGNVFARIRLHNTTNNTAEVSVNWLCRNGYRDAISLDVTRSVSIPPTGIAKLELKAPNFPEYSSGSSMWECLGISHLTVNGKVFVFRDNGLNISCEKGWRVPCSQSVPFDDWGYVYWDCHGYQNFQKYPFFVSPMALEQWPTEVEEYMGHDVIWLMNGDVLPPAVENALDKWVFQGGTLVRGLKVEERWPEGVPGEEIGLNIQDIGIGRKVLIRPIFNRGKDEVAKFREFINSKSGNTYEIMQALEGKRVKIPNAFNRNERFLKLLGVSSDRSNNHNFNVWNDLPYLHWGFEGVDESERTFLAIQPPRVPLMTLIFVMLIFVVLVGPVNYLWLKKRSLEPLILVTAPVLSLIFCLLVVLFVTFSEGWGRTTKAIAVTYMDQEKELAVTEAKVTTLAKLTPSSDLIFDSDEQLLFNVKNTQIKVNDKPGISIAPGIIRPRNVTWHSVRNCRKHTEKLRVIRSGEGFEAVNGLGRDVRKLQYHTEEGVWYVADNVPAGARVKLEKYKGGHRGFEEYAKAINQFEDDKTFWNMAAELTMASKGGFCAFIDKPAFFSPGFDADSINIRQIIYGPVKAE